MTAKKLNHCQACWSLYLARFNFFLVYHLGYSIEKPNTLSGYSDYGDRFSDNANIVLLCPKLLAIHALKEVELEELKRNLLSKIWYSNRTGDQKEPVVKAVQELQQLFNQIVYSIEQSNINSLLHFRGKIYIPQNLNLRRCIVALCYDTKIVEHSRYQKTLELVFWNYWWSQIFRYIRQYISTCNLYLWTKQARSSPIGELYLLQILDK